MCTSRGLGPLDVYIQSLRLCPLDVYTSRVYTYITSRLVMIFMLPSFLETMFPGNQKSCFLETMYYVSRMYMRDLYTLTLDPSRLPKYVLRAAAAAAVLSSR